MVIEWIVADNGSSVYKQVIGFFPQDVCMKLPMLANRPSLIAKNERVEPETRVIKDMIDDNGDDARGCFQTLFRSFWTKDPF